MAAGAPVGGTPGRTREEGQGPAVSHLLGQRDSVSLEVVPYLCEARLHAATKKDGGMHPIAVGNLVRRLMAKCCATRLQGRTTNLLFLHQLGVEVRGGFEAIVRTVRQAWPPNRPCYAVRLPQCLQLGEQGVGAGGGSQGVSRDTGLGDHLLWPVLPPVWCHHHPQRCTPSSTSSRRGCQASPCMPGSWMTRHLGEGGGSEEGGGHRGA